MLAVVTDLPRGRFKEAFVPTFIDVGALETVESSRLSTRHSTGPEVIVAESLPLADRSPLTPLRSSWNRYGEIILAPAC